MKTHELTETANAGETNPLNTVYKIDGKRVSLAEFDAIKRDPRFALGNFWNSRVMGRETFGCYASPRVASANDGLPDDSDPQDPRTHSLAARESHASAQDDIPPMDRPEDF